MDKFLLFMKWSYNYDKEGCWTDSSEGENTYELTEGASYPLPEFRSKQFEIRLVVKEGDTVTAEVYADSHTVTVSSANEPVSLNASNSYSAGGDSVYESLAMTLSIIKK